MGRGGRIAGSRPTGQQDAAGQARKSIHICILTSVHSPLDTRIFQKQARTLAGAGYQVTLVAPGEADSVCEGVAIRAVPRPAGRVSRLLVTGWRVLWTAWQCRADIYHIHDPELLLGGFGLKLLGKTVIYDAHEDVRRDVLARLALGRWAARRTASLGHLVESGIARRLDRVIVAREDILPSFDGYGHPVLISNYPRLELFPEPPPRGADNRQLRAVYVGGISEDRGITEVVQAMAMLPPYLPMRLDLYGEMSSSRYRDYLVRMPGFSRCCYHGWVDYARIPPILGAADIGVVCFLPDPNNVNAGPTKLFEYMAAGLPVVASHFPLWKRILEGHGCGICVDPTRPHDIARALGTLAGDSDERIRMGRNGRQAVVKHFHWGREANRLLALYAGLRNRG